MAKSEQTKRAMAVMAHADDAEFGCSGTISKLCSEGWEMVYVICTDGSKGSSDTAISPKALSDERRVEQLGAAEVLGLKEVVFLNHEDSMLEPTLELRKDIVREVRHHRPEIVICWYPARNLDGVLHVGHPDHIASGEATLSAVFPAARDHMTFPELLDAGFQPHKVSEVWIMGHPQPNHWIDVTTHIDTALSAIKQHKSQIKNRSEEELRENWQRWRRDRAIGKGMQYAEAFKRIQMRP